MQVRFRFERFLPTRKNRKPFPRLTRLIDLNVRSVAGAEAPAEAAAYSSVRRASEHSNITSEERDRYGCVKCILLHLTCCATPNSTPDSNTSVSTMWDAVTMVCSTSSSPSESPCGAPAMPSPQTAKYSCSSSCGLRRHAWAMSTSAYGWQKKAAVSSSSDTDRYARLFLVDFVSTAVMALTCMCIPVRWLHFGLARGGVPLCPYCSSKVHT
jgi:hypothetical protein